MMELYVRGTQVEEAFEPDTEEGMEVWIYCRFMGMMR